MWIISKNATTELLQAAVNTWRLSLHFADGTRLVDDNVARGISSLVIDTSMFTSQPCTVDIVAMRG